MAHILPFSFPKGSNILMTEVLVWYGIIFLSGLLAFPVSFRLFARLPERGYSFSKPLGLLLAGLLAWWGSELGLPFLQWWGWVAVGLLALLSGAILALPSTRREMGEWLRQGHNLRVMASAELVFLAAYAFMLNLRSFFPQLDASEKFFNLAFINSIATSPTLPAPDPWFAGQPMNYYYGGHYLMGFLCKLTGTEAVTGYNLGMGLVYGLLAVACFGLVANLVGLARNKGKAALSAGFMGVLFLAVLGNLHPLRQVLTQGLLPLGDPNFPFKVDWPGSARMIYDPMPEGKLLDQLTEYPIYSYLNGDLHAHLMGAPFVLVALGLIVQLFAAPGKWVLSALSWRTIPRFLGYGMLLGALYFINMGDFPTYLGLALLSLALLELKTGDSWRSAAGRVALQAGALLSAMWLVYVFYFTSFSGMLRGKVLAEVADIPVVNFLSRYLGWVNWPGTNLSEFLIMFGLFLFPVSTFLAVKYSRLLREDKNPRRRIIRESAAAVLLLGAGWLLRVELLLAGTLLVYISARLFWQGWKKLEAGGKNTAARLELLVLLLLFFAGAIVLFCENFYVRDIYANRFNTVFKYWYQLWVLFALAGVYCVWWSLDWFRSASFRWSRARRVILIRRANPGMPRLNWFAFMRPVQLKPQVVEQPPVFSGSGEGLTITKALPATRAKLRPVRLWRIAPWEYAWVGLLALLVISTTAVPTLAYWQVTNGYTNRIGLNGEQWYEQQFPAEFKAMRWLRDYTANRPDNRGVVLEANGMNYSWANRVSTYTGLPTIVGWPFHELQWRGNLNDKIIWESWVDMDRIYQTDDVDYAIALLKQHKVRYVFVGQIENGTRAFVPDGSEAKQYTPEMLAKFGTFMTAVYADPANNVYIYAFPETVLNIKTR
jgi:YYY domain-containing protein